MTRKDNDQSDIAPRASVISFVDAKQTHEFQRKEARVKAMRETFKAVREAHQGNSSKPGKGRRKKKK
ncbi:MAG: tRNA U34 5-carboxymethylaminomethyl modifying enzyme MnmG/GidA [Candidatus Azotimanducaceae bacterium]|jgi:tRNA U34 5-carboxymethylaminomethyl modifying enzyme MnmG/GidA